MAGLVGIVFFLLGVGAAVAIRVRLDTRSRSLQVAFVVTIIVLWLLLRGVGYEASWIAGVTTAALGAIVLQRARIDKISLRCSRCGNYYPSRDYFSSDQVCTICDEAAAT